MKKGDRILGSVTGKLRVETVEYTEKSIGGSSGFRIAEGNRFYCYDNTKNYAPYIPLPKTKVIDILFGDLDG